MTDITLPTQHSLPCCSQFAHFNVYLLQLFSATRHWNCEASIFLPFQAARLATNRNHINCKQRKLCRQALSWTQAMYDSLKHVNFGQTGSLSPHNPILNIIYRRSNDKEGRINHPKLNRRATKWGECMLRPLCSPRLHCLGPFPPWIRLLVVADFASNLIRDIFCGKLLGIASNEFAIWVHLHGNPIWQSVTQLSILVT